ncbi:O-antigen ligase family protein [Capnocytophaga genosp. AHN8471]|uniref:O-antigen ligase family protein n=1 Tax=Capnocytophaga genosp. AHN8471 TaxID=327574 RepID=A0ABS1YXU0_9FLAO|nr:MULTISPECIES: O-antigen ligase family protein [Capnocytophaga]EKY17859.1 tetratricopeptide repeat protein [Capnocytophaga sp. oral taxon 326 str. F0382]MBM0651237.1 O-antigen ligase family protein [Capnocytophaga genosp. AHN8471]MBM0654503.1 O-antigen ligase family protein [Capnocytophaga genosp. AHN8471]MBM0655482.1 O-antigen ligase family protein [Capnocytophaga genosp. AHN8471]MBM0660862.1 O-antigen ligase family protein [Capnocytophaga genosp. AHN8471]
MKPNNKKTSTAAVAAQPQNTPIKWLATFLLIAYGYVTVITPNWMAFDSNATKFYTFAILNLVVVALVFFIKEFRERTQVLFGFFTNKIGIAYSLIMVMALLSFSKAINTEEAILHFFKIFTAFSAAWMVSALVIYYKEGIVVLALAMTILLCYDFLVAMDGIKGVIKGTATDLAIKGSYSNKNILASAIFIKIPFAVWLFYFRRENYLRLIGAVGLTLGTLAVFFMSTRTFYLATILTVVIFVIYGAIDFFILKRRETGVKVLIHVGLVVIAFGIFSFVQNYLYPQEVRQSTSFGARLAEVANQENQSNNLRKTAWVITATDMIPNDPLLGVGIGNWKVRFLQYENSYSPHYIYMYKNHNDFLELTAEVGIFGGLAFVAIFLLAAFYFIKGTYKNKNSEQEQWFFLPLFGLFAYSFDAFFNFPQDRPEIQALFGIYVGIAVGLAVLYFGKNSKERKLPTLAIGFIGAIAVVAMVLGVIVERMYFDSSKIQRMVKEEQQGVRSPKSPADYLIRNYPRIPNLTAVAEPVDVEKARYLIDEKKFDEARKILSSIHYHPYDARPEYFMAVSYFMEPEKKLDSIYKYAHKARMIKPNFYGSLNLETFALNNLGKEQESIKLLKQFLSLEKDSIQKEEPKWKKRLKSIFHVDVDRDARLANRGEVQAWNSLAYLLEKNNQIPEARAVLDTAFVYLPTNQEIINNRNKIISRMQVEQFAPLYSEAMQLYLQQRYAEAIPVFTKFLEKVPAHIDGLKYRAISYYNTQQYQRAINDIAQMEQLGIAIDPVLNNYRASCYYMLGDRNNAKVFFQKAAAEGNADAQKNLNTLTF